MKLIHKNFLYTAIVAGILTILVLGYFVFMLPSLYVEHISNRDFNSIVKQHESYLKEGSYENVRVNNPACMTLDIPFSEEAIVVMGKTFKITITPATDDMRMLLSDIKDYVKANINFFNGTEKSPDKKQISAEFQKKAAQWKKAFEKQADFLDKLPFTLEAQTDTTYFDSFSGESSSIHYLSSDTIVIESLVADDKNQYTNYVCFTFNNDRIAITYLPTMTPQINEIAPVVISSLPMLIAVIILFALVVSYLYSKGIVDPIVSLVKHTQAVKQSGNITSIPLKSKGKDEVSTLIQTLNEMYEELNNNYKALEDKNAELKERNKRQEVFLRSSSHQLKTPIAAALLLVEGMINQVGKYRDVKEYLPKVKKRLLSMRKIVEDILYLNRCEENVTFEAVNLNILVARQLSDYQITLAEGGYTLITDYSEACYINTDQNLLSKIIDNLISNAIMHSKEGAVITISTKKEQLEIHNSNAHIDEKLLPDIFEPFVSGNSKGHGLGLYIVKYYAKILRAEVNISNVQDGVLAKVTFNKE